MWPVDMVHYFAREPWMALFILALSAVLVRCIRFHARAIALRAGEVRTSSGVLFLRDDTAKTLAIIIPGETYTFTEGCQEIEVFHDIDAMHSLTREQVATYVLDQYLKHIKYDEEVISRCFRDRLTEQAKNKLFPFDGAHEFVLDERACESWLAHTSKESDIVLLSIIQEWNERQKRKNHIQ